MSFFGLVWAASIIGSLFSSSQDLLRVPDHPLPTVSYRNLSISASFERSVFWRGTQLYSNLWSSYSSQNSLLALTFPRRWSNLASQSRSQPPKASRSETRTSSSQLIRMKRSPFISTVATSSSRVLESRVPTTILQLFNNLLDGDTLFAPSSGDIASDIMPSVVPVTVIKTAEYGSGAGMKADSERSQQRERFWRCSWRPNSTHTRTSSQQKVFQVWVKDHLIAELPTSDQAAALAERLREFSQKSDLQASQLQPALVDGMAVGKAGDDLLFSIDEKLATELNRSSELLAVEWINNLRVALDAEPLTLVEAQSRMYSLTETSNQMAGTASWYGPYFHGRLTATGERFNQNELTAAHPSLPFDTYLKVTNLESGDTVIVRINDRGPYVGSRSLDLSREAARCINSEKRGVVPYQAVIMKPTQIQQASEPNKQIASRL